MPSVLVISKAYTGQCFASFVASAQQQTLQCCFQECKSNLNTILAVTARGGHVAFLEGWWPFRASWMDKVAVQFFDTCNNAIDLKAEPVPRSL